MSHCPETVGVHSKSCSVPALWLQELKMLLAPVMVPVRVRPSGGMAVAVGNVTQPVQPSDTCPAAQPLGCCGGSQTSADSTIPSPHTRSCAVDGTQSRFPPIEEKKSRETWWNWLRMSFVQL